MAIFQFFVDFHFVSEIELTRTRGKYDKKNNLIYLSLVSAHWLYHVFNQNLIYFIDLGKIFDNNKFEWRQ